MDEQPLWITSLEEDAFVSVKPNTSPRMTRQAPCNWAVFAGRLADLLLVSISPLFARYLTHDTSIQTSSSLPPPASSLGLSVRHSSVISYTVCTFDQLSWIMVFRLFKVAWISARAENGKQTQAHHPLFLLSSNVSWLFRFLDILSCFSMWDSHPSVTEQTEREFVCFVVVYFFTVRHYLTSALALDKATKNLFKKRCLWKPRHAWATYVRWADRGCLWIGTRNAVHNLTHIKQAVLASHMASVCGSSWPHSYVYFTSLPCSSLTIVVVFDLPNAALAIRSFSTVLLLDNWKSEIKYYRAGLVSFTALEFAV